MRTLFCRCTRSRRNICVCAASPKTEIRRSPRDHNHIAKNKFQIFCFSRSVAFEIAQILAKFDSAPSVAKCLRETFFWSVFAERQQKRADLNIQVNDKNAINVDLALKCIGKSDLFRNEIYWGFCNKNCWIWDYVIRKWLMNFDWNGTFLGWKGMWILGEMIK